MIYLTNVILIFHFKQHFDNQHFIFHTAPPFSVFSEQVRSVSAGLPSPSAILLKVDRLILRSLSYKILQKVLYGNSHSITMRTTENFRRLILALRFFLKFSMQVFTNSSFFIFNFPFICYLALDILIKYDFICIYMCLLYYHLLRCQYEITCVHFEIIV